MLRQALGFQVQSIELRPELNQLGFLRFRIFGSAEIIGGNSDSFCIVLMRKLKNIDGEV